ncbi:MAG TPA: metallophosphoesterase [Bacteroidia bacterium]|jgi:hypothetical protein
MKNITIKLTLLIHFVLLAAGAFAQLKSIVYDFDGLNINQTDLPEGDYAVNDLSYRIAANPLAANDMIGDRVLKINLGWNKGNGAFGRGISRYVEFDHNLDRLNFFFYNPVSNNQDAVFDVVIADDDNFSNSYQLAYDDTWKRSLVLPGSSGWQFISIPLKDFTDMNTGGNGIFDIAFTSNKGMLLMTEFRFRKPSSTAGNPTFYLDMINFSEGNLPRGATVFDLPPKAATDYCLLGAYNNEARGQEYMSPGHVEALFPSSPGKKLKYTNWFLHWGIDGTPVPKQLPGNEVQILLNNGYTPIITWEPMFLGYDRLDPVQPRLQNIINGDYNTYIDNFANKMKTYTDTVIIRFMHEFEGDWYSWSLTHNNMDAAKYVAAFRHVVDRFRARGVTKVKWMWCVNSDYYPYKSYNWVVPAYPGDAYVDIIATDIYNNHYPTALPWWRSFRWQTAETYYYLTKYFPNKPLYICEVGCRERFSSEDPSSESKGAWYARMDKELQSEFRKVRALVFFNSAPDQNWFINSSASALQSLTDNIWNDNYYFKSVSAPPSACSGTGTISREVWNGVSGTSITAIPFSSPPSSTGTLTSFQCPENIADNYGQRVRGFLCPPVTGNYIFWIASDDNSELWLSTNDQPGNKQKIASVSGWTFPREWTKYPSQQSVTKYLVAGQKYYIEALHKEGAQGDHLAVGWQLPNGAQERPIPGMRLLPFSNPPLTTIDLITAGGSWKYLDNGTNQGTAWRGNTFNDGTWKTGNTELGYGDGGEATVVGYGPSSTSKYITTYFRRKFTINDISGITGLELSLIRDDGAVVYLNGVEIYRNNLPAGTISYNTLASTYIDGLSEAAYVTANVSSSALITGTNVIAVEIHQNSGNSSDISFNLKLKASKATAPAPAAAPRNVFAVIGDYGFSGPDEAAVANLVKSWQPEYILTVGDNNYPDGLASTIDNNVGRYYHDYIHPYTGSFGQGAAVNKFFPTPGNHDYNTPGAQPYYQYFTLPGNERYYDFIKGDVHFFALNSDTMEIHGTSATSQQAIWLKNKLAASTSKWKVVYFHHAPFCSDQVHGSTAYINWPFQLWGADAVISGHSHVYERVMKNGFAYMVVGLGGHSKYSMIPTPVAGSVKRYNGNFGAMQVEVKTDTLRFKFYDVNNNLIDNYPLIKARSERSELLAANITAKGPATFCEGGKVLLNADSLPGARYQWILNGQELAGADKINYVAAADGDYQVRVTNDGNTAWSAPLKVAVNSGLTARITTGGSTSICRNEKVPLYANTCSNYQYQWKRDGEDIPGATNETYYADMPGSYQVMIVSGSSVAWSALAQVTLNDCGTADSSGITETEPPALALVAPVPAASGNINNFFRVNVYPNPTTGLFTFDFCLEDDSEAELEVRVLNSVGQTVYRTPPTRFSGCVNETIELESNLATGVYFLQVRIGNRTENVKIILNR